MASESSGKARLWRLCDGFLLPDHDVTVASNSREVPGCRTLCVRLALMAGLQKVLWRQRFHARHTEQPRPNVIGSRASGDYLQSSIPGHGGALQRGNGELVELQSIAKHL